MNKKSISYQFITKSAAMLLVLGLFLSSTLQGKPLLDFCLMEMNHHQMVDDAHDCCALDIPDSNKSQEHQHDCEGTQICACTVETTLTSNTQSRVPTAKSSAVILSGMGYNFMVTSPDEFIYKEYLAATSESYPPLYLLYDTFLN